MCICPQKKNQRQEKEYLVIISSEIPVLYNDIQNQGKENIGHKMRSRSQSVDY